MKLKKIGLSTLLFGFSLSASAAILEFENTLEIPSSQQDSRVKSQISLLKSEGKLLDSAIHAIENMPVLRTHYLNRFELEGLVLKVSKRREKKLGTQASGPQKRVQALELNTDQILLYFKNSDLEEQLLESYALLRMQENAILKSLETAKLTPNEQEIKLNELKKWTLFEQGLKTFEQKNWKDAFAFFNQVLKLDPKLAEALNMRGRTRISLNDFKGALKDFTAATQFKSQYASAYFNKAVVFSWLKQNKQALEALNQAIAYNQDNALYYNNRGALHNTLGQFADAELDFSRAVSLRTQEAQFYRNRAKTWEYMRNLDKAQLDYTNAVNLAPYEPSYLVERGKVRAQQKNLKGALHDFTKALFLEPDYVEALYNRGQVYTDMNLRHLAVSDFTRAIELEPESPFFEHRGIVHRISLDQQKKAADYTVLIQRHPKVFQYYFERGEAYLYSRQAAKALADFETGMRLAQNEKKLASEHYFYRGLAYRELKRCDAATKDFKKACDMGLSEACDHTCGKQPDATAMPAQPKASEPQSEGLE
ncbi:hypothetical protein COW36_03650 [bacterium (Candidatus Blackallbacteria) CG17_big_fil_post_rev_8_21_14_2_50_48_46]|uniref:Tetratricopeptide repeat protein n=1 Tax=bacterium (Candidatus Blackallbacteria) CG17_big_fil_post_rev_8_21_14_2_50_48_46 TaxID=2014261 RepID=A0A2M7G8G6_9BACT|nr:MAG: hypothetical protein COW64_20820 [bacterium (Candidatus Blackallbacteria) CG18_big_fil_WC_8_21_14_2_50_49_26]PIW18396.1 MAG: hypothetical protein COW36_03650 [bacterium (Candidatus Blackallbacteria) CG17_big_fil_post_rev_8_21_14_2_50_48_46]PIW50555.1 MAG: hypothetical protein COW20_02075 [bacterium (Candidatus Blackallbacteria) CG13_big_fil_rev_8_21_14_2_50_49_14]